MHRRFTAQNCPPKTLTAGRTSPHRSFTFSSRCLAPLFVLFLAAWGTLNSRSALAQSGSAIQPAVVLDFSVEGNLDPLLGRKASDAVAVELQRSGDYEIVTRQQVEDAVRTQPGLRPPFNEPTQQRLAGVVGARSVFSGRVLRTDLTNRRSARVTIEVRQLDAGTGDYVNGAQISEITADKLQEIDNDVLVDEAINKAAFSAVRAMKQTRLPQGTVLNVTRDDIELNLGARNGVAPGQRYSVLRDVYNRAIDRVERVKVGEVTITRVEADQSTARLSAGGQAGVRTQDKVRQIFVPLPVSVSATGSSSPVTAPPVTQARTPSVVKKSGNLLIGGAALLGLIALAGFGGGSSNSPQAAPQNTTAIPVRTSINATAPVAAINVNYRESLPNILLPNDLLVGYLVFRGTSANFAATPDTLVDFVQGNTTTYTDTTQVRGGRRYTISTENDDDNGGTGRFFVEVEADDIAVSTISQSTDEIVVEAAREPLQLGVQYFYRVKRILAQRTTIPGDDNDDETTVRLQPIQSNPSVSSGGATAIPTPSTANIATIAADGSISSDPNAFNLDDFIVVLQPSGVAGAGQTTFAPGEINQIVIQVSTASTFPAGNTYEEIRANPNPNVNQQIVLDLNDIRVPNFQAGDQAFLRVGLRNSTDNPGNTIFSNALLLPSPLGQNSVASRFLSGGATGRRSGGFSLPGRRGAGGAGDRTPGHVLRPR